MLKNLTYLILILSNDFSAQNPRLAIKDGLCLLNIWSNIDDKDMFILEKEKILS